LLIKKEYIKLNEIIKKRNEVIDNVGNYNVYCGQFMECKNFILDLFKLIK